MVQPGTRLVDNYNDRVMVQTSNYARGIGRRVEEGGVNVCLGMLHNGIGRQF